MSTDKICLIESSSSEDTYEIGKRFGGRLKGGEVIVLASDLGGGKTTFTMGLAAGLDSQDQVGSPTFTVSRIYKCRDGLYLHHFDFYRLQEAGMVGHELAEVIDDPHSIIVIEWGDIVSNALPAERITVTIDRLPEGESRRCLNVSSPPGLEYVYEGETMVQKPIKKGSKHDHSKPKNR